jgi:hypothetical protein
LAAEARFPSMCVSLLKALEDPKRDLRDLRHGKGELPTYSKMPLFAGFDPREFADLLLRDGRFDHALLEWDGPRSR